MVFSLLGYFVTMIMVLTAAVGAMIGLFNFSTSERVSHTPHPRPAIERNFTVPNGEPRLFMSVPDTKDASPAKNVEASSAAAPDEKADAKKASLTSAKCSLVSATITMAMATRRAMPTRIGTGHSDYGPTGECIVACGYNQSKKEAAARRS